MIELIFLIGSIFGFTYILIWLIHKLRTKKQVFKNEVWCLIETNPQEGKAKQFYLDYCKIEDKRLICDAVGELPLDNVEVHEVYREESGLLSKKIIKYLLVVFSPISELINPVNIEEIIGTALRRAVPRYSRLWEVLLWVILGIGCGIGIGIVIGIMITPKQPTVIYPPVVTQTSTPPLPR